MMKVEIILAEEDFERSVKEVVRPITESCIKKEKIFGRYLKNVQVEYSRKLDNKGNPLKTKIDIEFLELE